MVMDERRGGGGGGGEKRMHGTSFQREEDRCSEEAMSTACGESRESEPDAE